MLAVNGVSVEAVAPVNGLGGLFDPQSEGALSERERALIGVLLSNDAQAAAAIPDGISADDLWATLAVCCKVGAKVEKVRTVLKMLVGRALVVMENRPEIYRERGFRTLDSFMSSTEANGLPALSGMARTGLYEARSFAAKWPGLPIGEMAAIGMGKMRAISRIRKGSDSDAQVWLDKAKTGTLEQLQEQIYRSSNGIPDGSLEISTVIFTMTVDEKKRIEGFVKDPEIQAYCGTAQPGPILCKVLEETESEWRLEIDEQEQSRR